MNKKILIPIGILCAVIAIIVIINYWLTDHSDLPRFYNPAPAPPVKTVTDHARINNLETKNFNTIKSFYLKKFPEVVFQYPPSRPIDGPPGEMRYHIFVPKEIESLYLYHYSGSFLNKQSESKNPLIKTIADDLRQLRKGVLFKEPATISYDAKNSIECIDYVTPFKYYILDHPRNELIPHIKELLKDKDRNIRTQAAQVLWKLEFPAEEFDQTTNKTPSSEALTWYEKGETLAKIASYDQAIKAYNKALESDPKYAEAYYGRGRAYDKKGDPKQAISDYTQAIELGADDYNIYYNRAYAHQNQGNIEEAIADYNMIIELNPQDDQAYHNRALAKKEKFDYNGAIEDYTRAIEINPDDNSYQGRGNVNYARGDYNGAVADWEKAIELNHSLEEKLRSLINKARDSIELVRFREIDLWYIKLSIWYDSGEYEKALTTVDKFEQIDPKFFPQWNIASMCESLGKYNEAIKIYDKNMEKYPNRNFWYSKAACYALMNDRDNAIENLRQAVEFNWYVKSSAKKDICFKDLWNDREFKKITKPPYQPKKGKEFKDFCRIGDILTNQGKYEEAVKAYEQAIEHYSRNVRAWHRKGVVLDKINRHEEALQAFAKSKELRRKAGDGYYRVAVVHACRKDRQNTFRNLMKAILWDDYFKEAAKKESEFQWVLNDEQFKKLIAYVSAQQKDSTRSTTSVTVDYWISAICGRQHTIAIKKDGTLWAWGQNKFGQLGLGDYITRTSPAQIGTSKDWKAVWANNYYSIALKTNGTLWAWGNYTICGAWDYKTVGNTDGNPAKNINIPTQIGSDSDWSTAFYGATHAMAIKKDGSLWGWGQSGLFGAGGSSWWDKPTPIRNKDISSLTTVTLNWIYAIARKPDGTLWSWGGSSNGYGELGIGSIGRTQFVSRAKTAQIGTDKDWKMVWSNATGHVAALKNNGTLWAWGRFKRYESNPKNRNKKNCRASPTQLGTDRDWAQVAISLNITMAVKTNGTLWKWGSPKVGDKGPLPFRVGNDTDWKSVVCGFEHFVAIKNDGTLWSWGRLNSFGQLGMGDYEPRTLPTLVTK